MFVFLNLTQLTRSWIIAVSLWEKSPRFSKKEILSNPEATPEKVFVGIRKKKKKTKTRTFFVVMRSPEWNHENKVSSKH